MKKILIYIVFSLLLVNDILAQAQLNKVFVELGTSANSYKGSLTPHFGNYTSGYHLGVRFCKKARFNGRMNFSYGHIAGQTAEFSVKNSAGNLVYPVNYFNTTLFTADYTLNFNFVLKRNYGMYVGAGIGLARFNVQDQFGNDLYNNSGTRDIGEDYSNSSIIFPIQLGAYYVFKNEYRIGLQAQLLNQKSDYFDNTGSFSPNVTSDNILSFKFYVAVPVQFSSQEVKQ